MLGMKTHLSIITLNINGLNSPIKRHKVAKWIKNHNPSICCLQETLLTSKDTHKLKVKGWSKVIHTNGTRKQAGVAIMISDKLDFKPKLIRRDKEGHFLLVKGTIQQEDITIVNIYAPNIGATTFIKETLRDIKSHIDPNTIILGDFNTPLTPLGRSSRQNVSKDASDLRNTINQMDLVDTYRIFHPSTAEFTFLQLLMEPSLK